MVQVQARSSSRRVVHTPPNPHRLFESLRDSGYANDAAVADIIDNSIDADATRVHVWVHPTEGRLTPQNAQIVVADDGTGMDEETLTEALKLGSDIQKDLSSDLGKYGMGLITASISMARELIVLTKTVDSVLLKGVHDLDLIQERDEFVTYVYEADSEGEELWKKYAVSKTHGTVVVLRKCDKLTYTNVGSFVSYLKGRLGQIFRRFIIAKSKKNGTFDSFLTVNEEPVYARDPLFLAENKDFIDPSVAKLLSEYSDLNADDKVEVAIDAHGSDDRKEPIQIRIVTLPTLPKVLNDDLGITANNCGIYIMRNEREIASAQTCGLFQKHGNLTRFRAEVHLPATFDKRIGLNWTKHRVEPDQGLTDVFRREIGPHVMSERRRRAKENAAESPVNHKPYEQMIARKSKLLTLPPTKKVERLTSGKEKGAVKAKETPITRTGTGTLMEHYRHRCEFRTAHMTAAGPIWEPEIIGRKTIITFNVDHPLWVRFIIEASDDQARDVASELLHLFSFCFSVSEQMAFGEGEGEDEKLLTKRSQMSSNLRILLS